MLLVGWMGEGVLSTTPWDSSPWHCGARSKWWLEKLDNVRTLWAGTQHCVEATLPFALSQSQACASAEPLLTYNADHQPQYSWHSHKNGYRISPNKLSLLQKTIYLVLFILTQFTHQIITARAHRFNFPRVCTWCSINRVLLNSHLTPHPDCVSSLDVTMS